MNNIRKILIACVFALGLIVGFTAFGWIYTSSQLARASANGVYPSAEEGMLALTDRSYAPDKQVKILYAGTNSFNDSALRYVIGSEVPIPGGATAHEEGVSVTKVEDVKQTIEVTREVFLRDGLESAWGRVVGVVVQPGVEFGDDFVLPYQPSAVKDLSKFIESQPMVYEAHSTDYQTREALRNLVGDHFAILKVGPGLTFAFREGIFELAMMEDELIAEDARSNIIQVLDDVMMKHPDHWKKYYQGTDAEQAFNEKIV